jgi:hypothetical protein
MPAGFKQDALQLDIIQQLFYRARQLDCLEIRDGFHGIWAENSVNLNFEVLLYAGGCSKSQAERR